MNTRRTNRSVRWLLTTGLLLTIILTLTGPAQAAGYVVTNLNDSGKGSLRQAILNSNAAPGADTITFSVSGTILLLSPLPAITDAAGLIIDGTGRSITISGNNAVRVMPVNSGAALALHNLTVAGGDAEYPGGGGILNLGALTVATSTFSGNNTFEGFGGGILNYGPLTVTDSTFSGNSAQVGGSITNFSATATVTNTTFSGNRGSGPDGGEGGGIVNYGTLDVTDGTFTDNTSSNEGGGILNYGTLTVTNSSLSGNSADYAGGGIHNDVLGMLTVTGSTFSDNYGFIAGGAIYNAGTLDVTGSTFTGNIAEEGAGIYNQGPLTVTDSAFSGNNASWTRGGGIANYATLTVTNSSFSSNDAQHGGGIYNYGMLNVIKSTFQSNGGNSGGGIFNDTTGTLTVIKSTFSDNGGFGDGGAISNFGTLHLTDSALSGNGSEFGGAILNGGTLEVTNSTFSGNVATDAGSGILNYATLTVTHSTFSGNRVFSGDSGAIANSGTLTLQNTIVADSIGENCSNYGSLIDGGGNLSWPDTTCPGLNADPLLGPLQDNGGPTQTHALLAGSPAIDAALLANCPATDQRGVNRPRGTGCDIGAYESVVYNFSGFFQPVDNLPAMNVVQAGVGIPVRFSLSGDHGLDIFAAGYPDSQKIACNSGAPQDVIEETVIVGSSSLSYDAATDTYTYVWKTSKVWANTCRQLIIRLNDGTEHKANFKFIR